MKYDRRELNIICILVSVQIGEFCFWGLGKERPLRTSTFISNLSSRYLSQFFNGGIYNKHSELFLVHFATFHNRLIDSEAVSTRSLFAAPRALSINLAFQFFARLYCS
jgi:hypothetical protein